MSGLMKKHLTKTSIKLKKKLMEKINQIYNSSDLYALNNVVDKYIASQTESLLPTEVFDDWNEENKKIGRILQGVRFREGLTQTDLAKKLRGVKQANISAWESGKERIPDKRLLQLSEILHLDFKKYIKS